MVGTREGAASTFFNEQQRMRELPDLRRVRLSSGSTAPKESVSCVLLGLLVQLLEPLCASETSACPAIAFGDGGW